MSQWDKIGRRHDSDKPAVATSRKPRLWLILLLCIAVSAVVSFVAFKNLVGRVPTELIGKWSVTDGRMRGATLEFLRNGTALAIETRNGRQEVTKSAVEVSDNIIYLTSVDDTGRYETVKQTILSLVDDELVIRDEDKNVFRMKRLEK